MLPVWKMMWSRNFLQIQKMVNWYWWNACLFNARKNLFFKTHFWRIHLWWMCVSWKHYYKKYQMKTCIQFEIILKGFYVKTWNLTSHIHRSKWFYLPFSLSCLFLSSLNKARQHPADPPHFCFSIWWSTFLINMQRQCSCTSFHECNKIND